MYLQGDLQTVFDALYHLGVIDPVLEKDWAEAMQEMADHTEELSQVVQVANAYQTDVQLLMGQLEKFDDRALEYLAMEVAREFADFHSRESLQ